jgi:hypothetical protein
MDDDDTGRPAPAPRVSIDVQIKAAKRELSLREHHYPRWIEAGTMNKHTAAHEIDAMRAILDTLVRVRDEAGLFPPS